MRSTQAWGLGGWMEAAAATQKLSGGGPCPHRASGHHSPFSAGPSEPQAWGLSPKAREASLMLPALWLPQGFPRRLSSSHKETRASHHPRRAEHGVGPQLLGHGAQARAHWAGTLKPAHRVEPRYRTSRPLP